MDSVNTTFQRLHHRRFRWVRGVAASFGLMVMASLMPISSSSGTVSAQDLHALIAVGRLARVPLGSTRIGDLPSSQDLTVGVALKARNANALAEYAQSVSTPGSAQFHHYLSASEFSARFAPLRSTVSALVKSLSAEGLRVGAIPNNRLLLPVSGTVGRVETALHTDLAAYRLAGGSLGWSATEVPRLPRSLADRISAVVGLDNLVPPAAASRNVAAHTAARVASRQAGGVTSAPVACSVANSLASGSGGWTESDIAQAYGLTSLYQQGDLGAGQTIAVFELEPFLMSDVATFDKCMFGVSHTSLISIRHVDGFNLSGSGAGEAALDVEELSALVPDAHIVVYDAANTTFGALDNYAQMVSDDVANIISTSWGECEEALAIGAPGSAQLESTLFEEAATQGQTVFASSGDDGSDDCANTLFSSSRPVVPHLSVDDPSSQPYVVAVGGTSLASDRQPLNSSDESVWNDGSHGGGAGGGISSNWTIPAWQATSGVPGVGTSGGREVPDVSASADPSHGITIYVSPTNLSTSSAFLASKPSAAQGSSGWTMIGGTSSAAPLWAAMAAEMAASGSAGTACSALPVTAGGADLGFIAPELYAVAATHYQDSFNDITIGANDVFALGGGYRATPGYDLASGLGSPRVTRSGAPGLASYLCAVASGQSIAPPGQPVVTAVSPMSGPTSGGGTATLTLSSSLPAGAQVSAQIGASQAQVIQAVGSTVVLRVPASGTAGTDVGAIGAGLAKISLTVSTPGGAVTSSTDAAASYYYLDASNVSATPTVIGVGPSVGRPRGGSVVTIYGSDFAAGPNTVTFGGVASSSVSVISANEIRAVVPRRSSTSACARGRRFHPSSLCQVDVVVTNASGTSAVATILPSYSGKVTFDRKGVVQPNRGSEVAAAATEFDYIAAPKITSVTPEFADASGSLPITIKGTGFDFLVLDWVNVGPYSLTQSEQVRVRYVSDTEIVIRPPADDAPVPARLRGGLSVQTGSGLSNVVAFGFAGVPVVGNLSVHSGLANGRTALAITGSKVVGTTSVRFVPVAGSAASARVVTLAVSEAQSSLVRVRTPLHSPGVVDVELCTATGCSRPDPRVDRFSFQS
jgi:hypothetical protein